MLTKLGGETFVARDGHEAVTIVDREVLDLVVSDIRKALGAEDNEAATGIPNPPQNAESPDEGWSQFPR